MLQGKDGKEISKDKHALIRLDIQNVSNDSIDYYSWATSPPLSLATRSTALM